MEKVTTFNRAMERQSIIKKWQSCWAYLPLIIASVNLSAGEKETRIIEHALQAYGGEKLANIESVAFKDSMYDYSQWLSGHSLQGAMVSYLNQNQTELYIDFKNSRKTFKQATTRLVGGHASDTPTIIHRIVDDKQAVVVDHALQEFRKTNSINFNNIDRGTSLLIDSLLIKQLYLSKDNAQWKDTAFIQGMAHDVLEIEDTIDGPYTVYINQESGLLTRLLITKNGQVNSYDFYNHQQQQGIVFAKNVFIGNKKGPVQQSINRTIQFNSVSDQAFSIPKNYQVSAVKHFIDVSDWRINQVADNVYFVGKQWGYTLFIDVGDYYISAGSWQMDDQSKDWQQGLDKLREKTGDNKPVKLHIVTHHHTDHMMGLPQVIDQGADVVLHPNHVSSVQEFLNSPLPEQRLQTVTDISYLANGKVMLFDVPNSHSEHNLVIYLPEQKILFSEDMFGSSFESGFHSPINWPDVDVYFRLETLLTKIKQLNLEVKYYLSSHHARVLTQQEIEQAMQVPRPDKTTLLQRASKGQSLTLLSK